MENRNPYISYDSIKIEQNNRSKTPGIALNVRGRSSESAEGSQRRNIRDLVNKENEGANRNFHSTTKDSFRSTHSLDHRNKINPTGITVREYIEASFKNNKGN